MIIWYMYVTINFPILHLSLGQVCHKNCVHLIHCWPVISLVPRPSDWWAGREREGLVSTACACAVIIQILNNPITHGYFLVYLPFDLNFCT